MAATDFSAFRTLALAYCQVDGTAYIDITDSSSNTSFLAVANEVLKRFCEETFCLFSDRIAWTLTQNVSVYSLRDTTAFANEVLDVQRAFINGLPILRMSEQDASLMNPAYLTATAAQPLYWFTEQPEQIVLSPKPDQAYSNCFVSGWYVHPTITAESGNGGTVFIRPEDIRCAARETAIAILEPRAGGSSLERLGVLRAENAAEKTKIRGRAAQLFAGPGVRRGRRRVYALR